MDGWVGGCRFGDWKLNVLVRVPASPLVSLKFHRPNPRHHLFPPPSPISRIVTPNKYTTKTQQELAPDFRIFALDLLGFGHAEKAGCVLWGDCLILVDGWMDG